MSQIVLTADTLSTATAGAFEYDGKVAYVTPQSTQRGVIPGAQFFRLNSDLAGANVTTAQSIFGVGVTLSASTVYAFETNIFLSKSAGSTGHTISTGFSGTATLNNIAYSVMYNANANYAGSTSTGLVSAINQATATVATNTISSVTVASIISLKGTVSINVGGTFVPQYTLSAAPGGAYSTVAGSYFLIYPIGASGSNTNVGTWA